MAPRSSAESAAAAGNMAPLRRRVVGADASSAPSATKDGETYFPKDVPYYRVPAVAEKYTGLLGDHHTELPWYKRVDWVSAPLLLLTPLLALYGIYTTPFNWKTYAFAVFWYVFTGMGITAGYHRLFAHRCYKAPFVTRLGMMLAGSGAVEGSILWWARGHRAHHKYVDTDKDPYAVVKGIFYAHMGWMLVKRDRSKMGHADDADLKADPIITFQHNNYLLCALTMAFVVPTLVCGLGWGDYWGGYFIAGVARLVFVHHSTFCVNSLAHYAGDATYTDGHTARNSIITALVTLGEGYHNFHHEFPTDYRNGVEWWQYDPTKVLIWTLGKLGLAYDLQTFPRNEIVKGQLQMEQKALEAKKRQVYWGPAPDKLPVITTNEYKTRVAAGEKLVVLDGFVLDVADFIAKHPGGPGYISQFLKTEDERGGDITPSFKQEVYKHSNAARNLAETFRVARIEGYWAK